MSPTTQLLTNYLCGSYSMKLGKRTAISVVAANWYSKRLLQTDCVPSSTTVNKLFVWVLQFAARYTNCNLCRCCKLIFRAISANCVKQGLLTERRSHYLTGTKTVKQSLHTDWRYVSTFWFLVRYTAGLYVLLVYIQHFIMPWARCRVRNILSF